MKTWASMAVGAAIGAAAVLAFVGSGLPWRYTSRTYGPSHVETRRNIITGETWERLLRQDWRKVDPPTP
jgi:hypothetical protein